VFSFPLVVHCVLGFGIFNDHSCWFARQVILVVSVSETANLRNLATQLGEDGYVRVKAAKAETTIEIARRFGTLSVIPDLSPVQELIPRAAEQTSASSYGEMYGLREFPLHTDMAHWYVPPHYFLLRCVLPVPHVKTLVVHSRHLFVDEDEVTLRRALFRPRRRLDGRLTSLRLYESGRYRWDPIFIVPITKTAVELRERIVWRIASAKIEELSLDDTMDCIIFDNWSVLHGRTNVTMDCVNRRIERVYLDAVHL